MKIVNETEFDTVIAQGPVVVDFYADWCGPCKMIAPLLEELAQQYPQVAMVKVNVDDSPQLAQRYGIMSIPALFAFKEGQVVKSVIGYQPKPMLEQLVQSAL